MQRIAVNTRGVRIGDHHHNAKLSNGEVELMRQMHSEGIGYRRLARVFEIGRTTVAQIIRYERRNQWPARWITPKNPTQSK